MSVVERTKRAVVAGVRRLPPGTFRRLPVPAVRVRLLHFHSEVLRVAPREFARAPTPYGFVMGGSTADLLQRNVFLYGVWEPSISDWVVAHLTPGDVVVDIGANVGYFSLLAASCVGPSGAVIAFEPVPSIVAALEANLRLNDARQVRVQPVIASDTAGAAEIFRGEAGNLGMSTTEDAAGRTSEGIVRKVLAADAVEETIWSAVRLVKVDTEGDDLRALRGLAPLLRDMTSGSAAVVEVTPGDLALRGQTPQELVNLMRDCGFTRMLAIPNSYDSLDYARGLQPLPTELDRAPTEKTDVIFLKP